MATKKLENMTFEETLTELDSIVLSLEKGDLPLDSALKLFERGVQLTHQGQKTLTKAEQRVEILLAKNENASLLPFDNSDDEY